MFSEHTRIRLACLSVLALLAIPISVSCGRKEAPTPPPRKNPSAINNLGVSQRGDTLLLKMTYPTTTLGGLALPGIDRLELFQHTRPAPEFMPLPEGMVDTDGDGIPDTLLEELEGSELEGSEAEMEAEPEVIAEAEDTAEQQGDDGLAEDEAGDSESADDPDEDEEEADDEAEKKEPNPYFNIRFDPDDFRKQAVAVQVLEGTDLEAAVDGGEIHLSVLLPDIPTEPPLAYHFVVLTRTGRLESPRGKVGSFVPVPAPEAPGGLELAAERQGIRLKWTAPEEAPEGWEETEAEEEGEVGSESEMEADAAPEVEVESVEEATYEPVEEAEIGVEDEAAEPAAPEDEEGLDSVAVYRRAADAKHFTRLDFVKPHIGEYMDRKARFGQEYVYAITSVVRRRPIIESELSDEVSANYSDDFPPMPPRDLVLLAEAGRVRLVWDVSPAPDLTGYLVFVSVDDGEPEQLTPEPIPVSEYVHEGTVSGVTYSYTVIAIDRSGNRSEASEAASTRAP